MCMRCFSAVLYACMCPRLQIVLETIPHFCHTGKIYTQFQTKRTEKPYSLTLQCINASSSLLGGLYNSDVALPLGILSQFPPLAQKLKDFSPQQATLQGNNTREMAWNDPTIFVTEFVRIVTVFLVFLLTYYARYGIKVSSYWHLANDFLYLQTQAKLTMIE